MAIKTVYDTNSIQSIVEKDEIAYLEQLLLFPQCFLKAVFFSVLKWVYMEESVKRAFGELNNILQDEFNKILSQQSTNVRFFFLSHNESSELNWKYKGPKHTHLAM